MSPFCTIFLPVRDGGHYIVKAVESVLAQSVSDWRLVILENASTDGTTAWLAGLSDPRVSIVGADRPLRIFENWDRGRQLLAAGEHGARLVTFLGHDDWLYPDFLADVQKLVERAPDASLYQIGFDLVDASGALIRPCRPIPRRESWEDLVSAICWGLRDSFGTGYLFRPGDYVAVGGIPDTPMLLAADDLLFARLTRLAYKACSATSGCAYRLHRGSTSGAVSPARIVAHIDAIHQFSQTMRTEFNYAETPEGRAALACLIAREIRPYDSAIVRRRLPQDTAQRLDELLAAQHALAPGVKTERWLGSNFITADAYALTRRWYLAFAVLRSGRGK